MLVTSERWRELELPVAKCFYGVKPHTPAEVVEQAVAAAADVDGLVGLGGGSAIDTAKACRASGNWQWRLLAAACGCWIWYRSKN